jgi:alanyl-tRNA synthetase
LSIFVKKVFTLCNDLVHEDYLDCWLDSCVGIPLSNTGEADDFVIVDGNKEISHGKRRIERLIKVATVEARNRATEIMN